MERTDQSTQQPSPLAPRPNQILAEPATPAACAADYEDAADVRAVMAQQDNKARRS